MAGPEPVRLVLIRHAATEWSAARRHTGRTDVPLSDEGRAAAAALRGRIPLPTGARVLTSPLVRARDTAALAGLVAAGVDDDLLEWDYGLAEGRTTDELRAHEPGWSVWDADLGDGETPDDVGRRADRVIARALDAGGATVLVAHAHILRILGARWLGLAARDGRHLMLDAASWSVLGFEREDRAIERWNVTLDAVLPPASPSAPGATPSPR